MNFPWTIHKLANQNYNECNIQPCEFEDGFPKCLGTYQLTLKLVHSTLVRSTYRGFGVEQG